MVQFAGNETCNKSIHRVISHKPTFTQKYSEGCIYYFSTAVLPVKVGNNPVVKEKNG